MLPAITPKNINTNKAIQQMHSLTISPMKFTQNMLYAKRRLFARGRQSEETSKPFNGFVIKLFNVETDP
jgi:hypothetical protein